MENFKEVVEMQRKFFQESKTRSIDFRIIRLKFLLDLINQNEKRIYEAIHQDLRKPSFEVYTSEISVVKHEIKEAINNIKNWSKPEKVKLPKILFGSKGYIYKEPYGVNLIFAPWNYPFQLSMVPLISSIAAGNCNILKLSEYSLNTSELILELINKNFPKEYLYAINGDKQISQEILKEKFDYIFFTGSIQVGKIVMQEAAKNLTPTTLELGGKSPAIVEDDCDISLAAKKIVWGKFFNAGQTCAAPDYVLVNKSIKDELIKEMIKNINDFYGEFPKISKDYGRIVNQKHFDHLKSFIVKEKIAHGGECEKEDLYIEPTILKDISFEDDIMKEEIFGPILPVLSFEKREDMINNFKNMDSPLSLYYFSKSKEKQEEIIEKIQFGGGCINDTLLHTCSVNLPFGGVGSSGIGSYHGKYGFETFSHKKSLVKSNAQFEVSFRYPPYKNKEEKLKKLLD